MEQEHGLLCPRRQAPTLAPSPPASARRENAPSRGIGWAHSDREWQELISLGCSPEWSCAWGLCPEARDDGPRRRTEEVTSYPWPQVYYCAATSSSHPAQTNCGHAGLAGPGVQGPRSTWAVGPSKKVPPLLPFPYIPIHSDQ